MSVHYRGLFPTSKQADVKKLVSRLRVPVPDKPRRFSNPQGPKGRLDKMRKTVTGLIQHERIELNYNRADEARQYAERLISEAIRHGDCHKPTMETASFWLLNKQLVHKLFKVLVPRFQNCDLSYTKFYRVPHRTDKTVYDRAMIELRGNPYPPIKQNMSNKFLIHNVLLDAAKYEYRQQKYAELAKDFETKEELTKEVIPDKVS